MLWAKFYFGIILPLVAGHQTNGTGCIYGAKPRIFLRMTLRSFFFAVSSKIDCELIVAIRGATMTPLTPFQRTTLTTFIYSAAQEGSLRNC